MTRLVSVLAILSWFAGGFFLGFIEIIKLPTDPEYSTLLQLLPLLLLVGGTWFVIYQYQRLGTQTGSSSSKLRRAMSLGWIALFGVDAGVASLNNMSSVIFHTQLPYYFQGISLSQKVIALAGIFVLGTASIIATGQQRGSQTLSAKRAEDFWERPLTNIGFIALLMGVVLGLAQYWLIVVFAGFILLLAGIMLYPVGRLTEKSIAIPGDD
jgi:hypothetical protein